MKGKSPSRGQTNFLLPGLREQLNPKLGLYRLAETINWDYFESEFSSLYSAKGRPAKLKTIAGKVLRELERKTPEEALLKYQDKLDTFKRFLAQEKHSKNKNYSLHEPEVVCYSKGKAHKRYEFGSKASIATTLTSCIIVGVESFSKAIHDSKIIASTMDVIKQVTGKVPSRAFTDLGYRGATTVKGMEILHPKSSKKDLTNKEEKARKRKIKRRSAIEPIISHLKSDHRMQRNFLKGVVGDGKNLLMAAPGFNFRKWIWIRKILFWILQECSRTILYPFYIKKIACT